MNIRFRDMGKHRVMLIDGDIDLYNVAELRSAFSRLNTQYPSTSIVVDLQGVTYMDSSAMGALLSAEKCITAAGGKFALANAGKKIKDMLSQSQMDTYFIIYDDDNFT